jgi:hypothetical protein
LVLRANKGDPESLRRLRDVLDANPEIWRRVGDLAAHALLTLARLIAEGDQLLFESIQRKAADLEAELLAEAPTSLERLGVQRVVACWLQLQYADTMVCTARENVTQSKFWSGQQDRAHRRYQSSVKQLLAIRELVPSTTKTAAGPAAEPGSPETTGGSDPNATSRPVGNNGNGKASVARPGDGEPPKPAEGLGPANGRPVNRILAFNGAAEVTTAAD